jgi:peptidoglycan/LPS O-acetylase OafA/YrhL
VSILLVLAGHSVKLVVPGTRLAELCDALAQIGVSIFFVISGFLITHLLVEERERAGAIDLRAFYLRRALRIVPPFFVFLGLLALARWLEGDPLPFEELAIAGGFLWNYLAPRETFALGHTWSLAVEEQFYLLWPGLLVLLGRRHAIRGALVLIALVPLIRIGQYFLFPASRGWIAYSLQGRLDTLMFGCALALLWRDERLIRLLRTIPRFVVPAALTFLLGISPLLAVWARGRYLLTVGETLEGVAIAAVIGISVGGARGRWSMVRAAQLPAAGAPRADLLQPLSLPAAVPRPVELLDPGDAAARAARRVALCRALVSGDRAHHDAMEGACSRAPCPPAPRRALARSRHRSDASVAAALSASPSRRYQTHWFIRVAFLRA